MRTFDDGYTLWAEERMDDFAGRIYDIDEGLRSVSDSEKTIVDYLGGVCCSLSLGLAMRRYLCGKFGAELPSGDKRFTLSDGRVMVVKNYLRADYDVAVDDVDAYCEIIFDIYRTFNPAMDVPGFTKTEIRRLLRLDSACRREKMFDISFALHMNRDETSKFLTDVLAEQSYNPRNPEEIIALFCQSNRAYNRYSEYKRLIGRWRAVSAYADGGKTLADYTNVAGRKLSNELSGEEELFEFLNRNAHNFNGFSETAYKE
ncbi:MAG: hypothetical protein K6C36_01350, partial [Clostridia bacterium]|nr:hypothetical protein [Clostridia bacterium]